MTRKGYEGEYRAKIELGMRYGKINVIKAAIAQQGFDFFAIKKGRIDLQVEVKETISRKYYPSAEEKKQIEKITDFGKKHNIRSELWIYYRKGAGVKIEKEVRVLYEPKTK